MVYFENASTWLLESLQGVRRTTQISEKLELVTKIMFRYHLMAITNWQIFIRFSVNISNFIQCMQKLSIFLLFCLYTQNVAIK